MSVGNIHIRRSQHKLMFKPPQVKCDRRVPTCRNCDRLRITCPGYANLSREELQASVESVYRASGVERRRTGACEECRRIKSRCSRTRPVCHRCAQKKLECRYPPKFDAQRGDDGGSIPLSQSSRFGPVESSSGGSPTESQSLVGDRNIEW